MLYYIFIFLLVSIYLLIKTDGFKVAVYLIYVMTSFTIAVFAVMFYLSKDTWYYNTVNNYFHMPATLWTIMMLTPISKEVLINIMNAAMLSTIFSSLCFAFSFYMTEKPEVIRRIRKIAALLLFSEFILYTPSVYRQLYLRLYPSVMSLAMFQLLCKIVQISVNIINICIILLCLTILYFSCKKVSPLRMFRRNIFAISADFLLIIAAFLFIFGPAPHILIKVSRIANTVDYLSFPLIQNRFIYSVFPIFLIFAFVLMAYVLFRFSENNQKISEQTLSLSKEIEASDMTSRVFCHYLKNELLAIQAEVEMLPLSREDQTERQTILDRCDDLYNRLDQIHRAAKPAELFLRQINLCSYIPQTLQGLSFDLAGCQPKINKPKSAIMVMLDPNVFEQALYNIYVNSIEAMYGLPSEKRQLSITLQALDNWAVILIQDNGCGMSRQELSKIFDPYYTSAPIARHWGIGLSLTHKVITAHEGFIEADSTPGKGTVMKIMLPRLIIMDTPPKKERTSKHD